MTDNSSMSDDCLTPAEMDKLRALIAVRNRCNRRVAKLSLQGHFPFDRWPAFKHTWVEGGYSTDDGVLLPRGKLQTPGDLPMRRRVQRYTVEELQRVQHGEYLPFGSRLGFVNQCGTICWFNTLMIVSLSS
jgi:hypothetical protein